MEWKNWETKNYNVYIWNDFIRFSFDLREGTWGCAVEKNKGQGIFTCHSGLKIHQDSYPDDFWTSSEYNRGWMRPEDILDNLGKGIKLDILHESNLLKPFIFEVTMYETIPFAFIKLKCLFSDSLDFVPAFFFCRRFEGPVFGRGELALFNGSKVFALQEIIEQEISDTDIIAIADKTSNSGCVLGFSNIVNKQGRISIQKKDSPEIRLISSPIKNEGFYSQTIVVGASENIFDCMERYADFISHKKSSAIPIPKEEIPVGWSSRDMPVEEINEENIISTVKKIKEVLPVKYVQIDYWWEDKIGNWQPDTKRFPQGLKLLCDTLKAEGFIPGLWIAPFCASKTSRVASEHPDWFLKDSDGNVIEKDELIIVDVTNPSVSDWIKTVIERITKEWGFEFLKLDLLHYEAIEDKRYNTEVSPIQSYLQGIGLVKSSCAENVYIAGSDIIRGYSILSEKGIFDNVTIGSSSSKKWEDIKNSAVCRTLNWYLHSRIWINSIGFLNINKTSLNPDEIKSLISLLGVVAGAIFVTDTEPQGLEILKGVFPTLGMPSRPIDMFEKQIPSIFDLPLSAGWEDYHIVTVFNWDDEQKQVLIDFSKLGLNRDVLYRVFEYWEGAFIGTYKENLLLTLSGHSSKILSIRQSTEIPQIVGTTAHILQGFVDVESIHSDPVKGVMDIKLTPNGNEQGRIFVFIPSGYAVKNTNEITLNPVEGGSIAVLEKSGRPELKLEYTKEEKIVV
jgi:alpha-galactosidase